MVISRQERQTNHHGAQKLQKESCVSSNIAQNQTN